MGLWHLQELVVLGFQFQNFGSKRVHLSILIVPRCFLHSFYTSQLGYAQNLLLAAEAKHGALVCYLSLLEEPNFVPWSLSSIWI